MEAATLKGKLSLPRVVSMDRKDRVKAVELLRLSDHLDPEENAIQVDIPKKEYEFARGDNITLPCTFKSTLTNPSIVIITWSAAGPDTPAEEALIVTHYHPDGLTDISPNYEGRVSVDVNVASGKADLKLSSITVEDNKEFECLVQIPRDNKGQPADTARLTVLESTWNEDALMDTFIGGLNERIKDVLSTREFPLTLRQLEEMATQIDLRLTDRRRERGAPMSASPQPRPDTSSASAPARILDPEPMQLGRARLTPQERSRRHQLNLCLYCGGEGHRVSSCPLKVTLSFSSKRHKLTAFVDSGVDTEFMDEAFEQIQGARVFTKLDLLFQHLVNEVLMDMVGQFVFVYLDDIIIYSRDLDSHKKHIAMDSTKGLSKAERNYDVGDRELLAVKLALEEWRHWLEGAKFPFLVWTDHKNLEPGTKNVKPDALSLMFEVDEERPSGAEEFILPESIRCAITMIDVERECGQLPKSQYEFARGDNITLPCTFKSTQSNPPIVIISWSAEGPDTPAKETLILTYYYPTGTTDISPKYEGRVDVNVASGKADLKLSSITMAENKEFECRVQIPRDDEGQPADMARLTVLVWSAVAAIQVDIPKSQYEFAKGDNITLPCTFKSTLTNPSTVVISWSAAGPDTPAEEALIVTHYHPDGSTDIQSNYEGRVSMDVNVASGKADLKLFSITMADNKKFECLVQIPKDNKGQPADTASLTVLVAPSKPICKIQGIAEYGQNINLTCYSEEGSPPPTYKWDSRDVMNMPRVPDPRTTDKGGILSLFNISKDTSGFYTCTSSNKIRSASCNITVAVMPPSLKIGSTAGIIAGVIIALIILVIAIFCCCRRKNKNKNKNRNEERVSMNGYCVFLLSPHPSTPNKEELQDAKEPLGNGDGHLDVDLDKSRVNKPADRRDDRSDYADRRSDYDDRRTDYDDRRSDYDDRRSDYDDRRSDYDDRRTDYDDRRSKHSDRHERYDDDRRFEDKRRYNDRRDPRYDDDRYNDRDKP
ncbi:uncharacterized protein V3H82_022928 [Fundulus diaphanus]